MGYNPDQHHRRSIRLRGYDYAQAGLFFVTICTQDRECLFGEVVDGELQPSEFGLVVESEWLRTPELRPNVELDAFIVMPNHLHGIILLADVPGIVGATRWVARGRRDGATQPNSPSPRAETTQRGRATQRVAPTIAEGTSPARLVPGSLGAIVGQFKSTTAKRVNQMRGTPGTPLWQRNYYEHIVRNERALDRIRAYIEANPSRWASDEENPANTTPRR